MEKIAKKYSSYIYFAFRLIVGLLFLQHGLQKLFGLLGGSPVDLLSMFGLAGVIEFIGGLMIIFGLFTRFAALVSGIDMIAAWFIAHVPQGWVPIQNNGELALLYLAAFLALFVYGSGSLSFDAARKTKVTEEVSTE